MVPPKLKQRALHEWAKLYMTATALKHIRNIWNLAHREDDIQDIHRVSQKVIYGI